jgi:hypothetical protein
VGTGPRARLAGGAEERTKGLQGRGYIIQAIVLVTVFLIFFGFYQGYEMKAWSYSVLGGAVVLIAIVGVTLRDRKPERLVLPDRKKAPKSDANAGDET